MTLKSSEKQSLKKNKGKIRKDLDRSSWSSVEQTKDFYQSAKITVAELREFKEHSDKTDEELEKIADALFDLAVVAMQIIKEDNKKEANNGNQS